MIIIIIMWPQFVGPFHESRAAIHTFLSYKRAAYFVFDLGIRPQFTSTENIIIFSCSLFKIRNKLRKTNLLTPSF